MAIERIVPGTIEWEAFYANHICRYQFAKEQVEQMQAVNILDAATGVGYGSHFLAANNSLQIRSVDRSKEALDVAQKNFAKTNISFFEDDCHTLKNATAFAPYDCIISFETLEHLPQPASFIKSCYANLKQGGKLIVSTPNQPVSSPGGVLNWEFHEKEYTVAELRDILSAGGFSNIMMYGQKYTSIGRLRNDTRASINTINSNPFMRLGRMIQKVSRGRKFHATLPEQTEDFEIVNYKSDEEITLQAEHGPFVLIAVCEKQ
jgi:SAM-dependent methyltransferase